MEITNTREIHQVHDADLTDSRFSDAKLTNVQFNDVNLQGSAFTKANLAGARFRDVNLASATIEDANLAGMSINGALVTDLIRAFRRRARMVIYAKDLAILRAFYQGVFQLEVEQTELDHVVLGSSTLQLVIVQVPASIALRCGRSEGTANAALGHRCVLRRRPIGRALACGAGTGVKGQFPPHGYRRTSSLSASIAVYRQQAELSGGRFDGKLVVRLEKASRFSAYNCRRQLSGSDQTRTLPYFRTGRIGSEPRVFGQIWQKLAFMRFARQFVIWRFVEPLCSARKNCVLPGPDVSPVSYVYRSTTNSTTTRKGKPKIAGIRDI